MKTSKKNTSAKRRRDSNRNTAPYRIRNRMGTSFGQPVHIGFYLNPLLNGEGNIHRKRIVELFNQECHG